MPVTNGVSAAIACEPSELSVDTTPEIAGATAPSSVAPRFVNPVTTGMSAWPIEVMEVLSASCDWLYAIRSALASWYFWPASPYAAFSAPRTSCCRSCSVEHAASAALNASSLDIPWSIAAYHASCAATLPSIESPKVSTAVLVQFRASAKEPVTVPTLAVSFAASASPSMGIPSPNCEYAPVRDVVSCSSAFWLSPHSANALPAVSTVRSVSPSTPISELYVEFMA